MYEYQGRLYPDYLREGNAARYITEIAKEFCRGPGIDVGAGLWPLVGSIAHDVAQGGAYALPEQTFPYVFSSHCLEHLDDPIRALEHWKTRIRPGGCLFLYLPHPDMTYWRPQHCRKHRHIWRPAEMAAIVADLGYAPVIHSERDMYWSFTVVGFKP